MGKVLDKEIRAKNAATHPSPDCWKPEFVDLTDVEGNTVSVRVCDVMAVGESKSHKYNSWLLLRGMPAGDTRLFLKETRHEVKKHLC